MTGGETYGWPGASTYIANPPYFAGMQSAPGAVANVTGARVWGFSATRSPPTTSARPVTSRAASPAGKYLQDNKVGVADFNSMARGAAIMK